MDIVACIAVIVSGIGTLAHVFFDYKKSKQKKDIIWGYCIAACRQVRIIRAVC